MEKNKERNEAKKERKKKTHRPSQVVFQEGLKGDTRSTNAIIVEGMRGDRERKKALDSQSGRPQPSLYTKASRVVVAE